MKIGIDISQIVYKGTGVTRFTEGLTKAILTIDHTNEWVFFFSSFRRSLNNDIALSIKKKNFTLIKYPFPPTLLSLLWNDLHIINIERLVGHLDFFITSDWAEPPSKLNKVTVVHDLVYLRYPDTVDKQILKVQKKRLSWVKKESAIIFADSETTRKDLINLLSIENTRIKTIYPGVEVNKPQRSHIQKILKKFNLTSPFILTVSKIEPRKNINRLIQAFSKLHKKSALELVVVGEFGWGEAVPKARGVHYIGFVTDEELTSLYSSCLFFVYPSIWEGFGYPIIEAMAYGAPVTTSNISSLGEIGRDAALLFDPQKTDAITDALNRMTTDENLRNTLRKKGLERSRMFTWEKYYNNMIEAIREKRG
ncbi:glycosyltransferase family 4 protein [Candidatus Roizmanbacteria bacterium]|nr:glycosyltransferase family 4 protein [Candidatus Roizmanbacteria bacterium]